MRCPTCGTENPASKKFCGDCGSPLSNRCPKCGADSPLDKRFCGDCGTALPANSSTPAPDAATAESHRTAEGERRHLTVLFCDLVNSTGISAHLDPEDWHDLAAEYQHNAAEAVTRFGGYVAKYLGDGLLVFFGYPQAHEDDPERAVRAGLAIVDGIAALNDRLADKPGALKLSVRVGIHTGAVVVAQGGGKEADVFGAAPNIASRVQGVAEPDTVMMTSAVVELVSGRFVVEDRGAHELKGIEQPVRIFRAVSAGLARGRGRSFSAHELAPFVGRDDEMHLLLSRWKRVRDGQGQLVIVTGEPGIGKSRLMEEFRRHIKGEPHLWIECACALFFANSPFHAVTQMLDQGLGWRGDESPQERVSVLERVLELSGMKTGDAVPLIAEMLNLPIPEKYPALSFSAEQRRRRLLGLLAAWVFSATGNQPLVIVMEDLHWVDPSTVELIQTLVEQGATAPLMLLCTARPEFRSPWPMRAHHAQLTLNRLDQRQTLELVAAVISRAGVTRELIDAVVNRTDGVPLFAEELTRLLLEGDGRSVVKDIPATLRDSLMARLDRLGRAKEVAQVAAVIGRDFSYALLQAVARTPEAELQLTLTKLADAELLYVRGIPPEATYQFKHALIQDTAYEALLKSKRKELHLRVARAISEKFPPLAEAQPEILARHWSEAGETEPAIAAWTKAARAAEARHALKEAEEDCRQALAILKNLPESRERDTSEFTLLTLLTSVLHRSRGYSTGDLGEVLERARVIAERTGNLILLVLQGMAAWVAVLVSGDYSRAQALADQLLDLAQREGSDTSLGFAHAAQVSSRFYRGDLIGLEEHFARLRTFSEAPGLRDYPGAVMGPTGYATEGLWILGHPEKARSRIADAIGRARNEKKAFDIAVGRDLEAYLCRWLKEPQLCADAASETVAISEEHGFSDYRVYASKILGWARAQLGKPDEGAALIRENMAVQVEAGVRNDLTNSLTLLAEAQALDGKIDEALLTLDEALVANPEELVFRPNILTWRGQLRLRTDKFELAEADFRDAIALAGQMSAKSLELRATMSLARHLRDTGRRDEAGAMLAEIYNWFTEGFDTADLKDAKALLDELSQ